MVWKELDKSSPGSGTKFGSDDIDKISKLFNGDAAVDTVTLDSNIIFMSGRIKLRSTGAAIDYTIVHPSGTTARNLSVPTVGQDDTFVMVTQAQTLVGKTLTSPIISTISNTGTLTLPTSTDTLVGRATTDTLTNKTISGASNTISNIPSSALPATVVENDQNNDLGDFYLDFGDIAAPADPGAGKIRLFLDTATGEISVRKSNSTTVSLEATGGGGSWDPAAAETLTNKTIAYANNTLTGVASLTTAQTLTNKTITFADNTLTNVASLNTAQTFGTAAKTFDNNMLKLNDSAGDHAFTVVTPDLAANRNLSVPLLTGHDTLVTEAHTQTLTNKTLTTPIISSISNSGTVTIPTGTDTLVNLTGTQTLTGKTIAAASNTLTGVSTPSSTDTFTNKTIAFASNTLTNVASTNTAQTFGTAAKTFENNMLKLRDSNDSHSYTIVTSDISADRNITVPALTGHDTVVTEAHIQTLTNKTLTTPVIATIKPDASNSLNVPVGNDTLAALTLAQTLTNKVIAFANNTLTDVASLNTAQTFTTAAKTFNNNMLKLNDSAADHAYTVSAPDLAANRTLNLPLLTGDDTVVTQAHTQTITNKTVDALTNTTKNLLTTPEVKFMGGFPIGGTSATLGSWGQLQGGAFYGNGAQCTNQQNTTVGTVRRYPTTTTLNNQSGIRIGVGSMITAQKPRFRCKFKNNQITQDQRILIMFSDGAAAAPTSGSDDPLNNLSGFGLMVRSTDTTYRIAHNDGGTPGVYDDTTVTVDANWHILDLYSDYANTQWQFQLDGGTVTNVTTDIPGGSIALGFWFAVDTATTAARSLDVAWNSFEWINLV